MNQRIGGPRSSPAVRNLSVWGLGSPSVFPYVFFALFLLLVGDSWQRAEVDFGFFFEPQGRAHLWQIVSGMYPPELSREFLEFLIQPTFETIQISVMGTLMAVLIGFPLGLLASSTFSFRGSLHEAEARGFGLRRYFKIVLYGFARGLLSLFRCIPEFVWAFMFVRAVGLGPFPGVLAIGVAYGGMLGKVYSEIFESVNERPLEAIQSTGATRLQVFFYGWFPQVLPNVTSYTLYRWECAVRTSAILGLVGAGGIGQQIEISLRMFNFQEVSTLLVVLFSLVAGADYISAKVRSLL